MCLRDEQDLALFTTMMKSVAMSERMEYSDSSAATQADLTSIYRKLGKENPNAPAINIFVLRKDGMGLGAGNMGLPRNQLAVGFSEGADSPEAQAFANKVISKLKSQWVIENVPPGKGALPLGKCPAPPSN
jgi:hypothetical protein